MLAKHTSIKNRRKQAHADIIEDILKIARGMMQKDGVGALSFNAIARELGIKPPSLYTYFDSKNAIYDELFRRGFILLDEKMKHPEGETFNQQITSFFKIYMSFAYENPDMFQIMFQRAIPDFVPSDESMAISLRSLSDAQARIRDKIESEEIKPNIPPDQALDIIISMMHGLATMHMANHPNLPVGEGRFGQVIDHAAKIFTQAWQADKHPNHKE